MLASGLVQILTLAVAITMLLTPLLFIVYDRIVVPLASRGPGRGADEPGTVILAGVGRFGQVVNRMLTTNGHKVVVLDQDARIIARAADRHDASERGWTPPPKGDATP